MNSEIKTFNIKLDNIIILVNATIIQNKMNNYRRIQTN